MNYSNVIINNTEFKVKIAKNIITQTVGLMFKKQIKKNEGLLFVFKKQIKFTFLMSFWMLFTYIPLDIIWIDENKKIVDIQKNTIPWGKKTWIKTLTTVYTSKKPFKYALEIKTNDVQVKIGDKVNFI